ncbi:MAG: MiaB/RimO family radical SAM methylthiotransferase [candidate division WOR-3 bacterium]|nr:MAG: MiaB/RimO family radical SAM methylthiotransferase [candidate division WOR-3 bacterium]
MQKLINLGCKLNQYEGYCLLEAFSGVDDLVIVNTCCVTREAELNSQKKFRQACRQFPNATIIATGCACRTDPERFKGATYLIDNVDRNTTIKNVMPVPDKARYFLKIQDGCDTKCSYCIVAQVRSRVESKPLADIEQEIIWARSLGHREIVLVGANIGLYGRDSGSSLNELLMALGEIKDCPRIRLSSIEPFFITQQLIDTMKRISVCRHFHIPIQSADDVVLKNMNRAYDRAHLKRTVEMIHNNFQDVAIGADVIVGFPGEDDERFMNTYRFLQEQPFTHVHVFPYSPRPRTEAYRFGDPVPKAEKKDRLWRLKELVKQKNYQFRRGMVHKKFMVTVEHKEERCSGLTDNYIKVGIDGECAEKEMIEVIIDSVTEDRTHGVRTGRDTQVR